MIARAHSVLFLASILLFAACSDAPSSTPPPGTTLPSGTQAAAPTAPPPTQLPANHPPVAKSDPVTFTAPAGWVSETPKTTMRKAQFKLPRQGTDAEDATVAVFFFGPGQGGPVEDNLMRWAGEYEQPDGKKSSDVMKRSTRKVNGMDVTEMDVSGTFVAAMPGSGEAGPKKNWRTLAAIVESPGGSFFVKLTGPVPTVAHWESSFREYISSAKASS